MTSPARRLRALLGAVAALASLSAGVRAEIALAPLFTDGAVLQRDKPIAVWGTAAPGATVTVTFAGQTATTISGLDQRWVVLLDPLPASTQGAELTVAAGKENLVIHDVLVGDVWVCSGQSNMEFTVSRAADAEREIAAAHYPLLRHIQVERQAANQAVNQVATSGWQPATPALVGRFTAVGYFFGRDIVQKLGVPIGLVHSSWGGTPIEAWLSPMALASNPEFQSAGRRWAETVAAYPKAKADYEARLAAWNAGEAAVKARGEKARAAWLKQNPVPRPPLAPDDPARPAALFNGMINPLVPYGIRGFLWYQGESNTDRPGEYHALFAAMITAWRAHFGQGDLPFFWVNLPAFRAAGDPTDRNWAFLREAQTQTLTVPNTGEAVAIDLGDPLEVHPTNKQEIGRRLALLAKHRVYGITADDTGPTFAGATREGAALRVSFSDVGSGLVAHNKPPQALELAGSDHVFHPATGRIEKDTLIVTSPEVRDPVAVRYGFRNAPEANLSSGAGLPVVPFRSDDW